MAGDSVGMLSRCLLSPLSPLLLHPSWIAGSPRYRMASPTCSLACWAGQEMFALGDQIGKIVFMVFKKKKEIVGRERKSSGACFLLIVPLP